MKNMFLILILALSLFNCNDNSRSDDAFPQNIAFTIISNNALRGNGSEGILQSNLVISNTDNWQNLITKMNSVNNVSDNFSETDIDFENYFIIAVFLEVKSSDWSVEVTKITENENNLVVTTNENESIASVIAQPYSIVKIPITEKTIEFE